MSASLSASSSSPAPFFHGPQDLTSICVGAPGAVSTVRNTAAAPGDQSRNNAPAPSLDTAAVSSLSGSPRPQPWPSVAVPPILGADATRYVPATASPLRQMALPPAPRTALNLLQMGDARFAAEGSDERAVYYWLAAELVDETERRNTFHALLPRVATGNVPLNLFHIAHLAPTARHGRMALRGAAMHDPSMLQRMDTLLARAKSHPSLAGVYLRLERNFAALLPRQAPQQVYLVHLLKERSWDEARALAKGLGHSLPHLLAPRCARFICDEQQAGDPTTPGVFGEAYNAACAGADVLRFVLDLDADGHVQALGALGEPDYRGIWGDYLERFFRAAPLLFVGNIANEQLPHQIPAEDRRLCGLAWPAALSLPFPRSWREQVACVQEHEMQSLLAT